MTDTPRGRTIRNGYDVLAYWEKRAKDAEAVVEAAKAEVFAQGYRSTDMANALKTHAGEFWFEEYVPSEPTRCDWSVTTELDDGPDGSHFYGPTP